MQYTSPAIAHDFIMHTDGLALVAIKPASGEGFITLCDIPARGECVVHFANWHIEPDGRRTLATSGGRYFDSMGDAHMAFDARS